ncbi:contractile injection system protein, VgrG/Pvc8 family [Clostridium sp. Marseille-P2415]|uniref:contractile injection system protein, VgrG/Pvc8 family n=1 Tax=Clostridium sp. Marseille-P2415 TaxID=1805471 RepID=UPI00098871E5|nr:contractile injection system protein, VgrG/Pvc8 family [Clostridium sp. Marseille-P2415]
MGKEGSRQIKTSLEMISEITDFSLTEELNEHGRCVIKGIIADGSEDKLVLEKRNGSRVRVFLDDGTAIFAGMMDEISVFLDGDLYKAEIKLVSASYLMDIERKSGSFQNAQQTYQEILNKLAAEYDGGDILDYCSREKTTGSLIVQYEETDWEFLKRLASHFHAGIMPDTQFENPKIYFGLRAGTAADEISSYAYTAEKNLSSYKQYTAEGHAGFTETDAVSFQVTSGQYYKPGSIVAFRGMQLYIGKLEAKKEHGEVVFRYRLYTEKGLERPRLYAERLTGVSIGAKVVEAVKDKVRVRLDIDSRKPESECAWEFPYQTMYTAGDEGGWYCMPEPEDTVSIYFPGKKEEDAVAENSSRTGKNRDEAVDDPAIKYFRTIDGKEIRFTREAVIITCNDGTIISLDENDGISIESEKGITLSSRTGINIDAEESIEFYASDRIRLHCKKSQIQMDTMIDISGPDVRIN